MNESLPSSIRDLAGDVFRPIICKYGFVERHSMPLDGWGSEVVSYMRPSVALLVVRKRYCCFFVRILHANFDDPQKAWGLREYDSGTDLNLFRKSMGLPLISLTGSYREDLESLYLGLLESESDLLAEAGSTGPEKALSLIHI